MRQRKTFTHRTRSPDPELLRLRREHHAMRGAWTKALKARDRAVAELADYKATHTEPGYRLSDREERDLMRRISIGVRRMLEAKGGEGACEACGGYGIAEVARIIRAGEG